MKKIQIIFWDITALLLMATLGFGQSATITESIIEIPTYPFSDPNPISTLVTKPAIYPYHRFDGYSHQSIPKEWKVVTLENDYIQVFILPEAGGKVWGAIEKSTGRDFIYKNEVMKFRNISMRGPWTSGGIEFNFGLIGHTPSTATPVDYITTTEPDGSVICTVGMIDLPSRTQWRVKINLQPDKAYFSTSATWYNPTALPHPYYNWMTAAAKTSDDLVFYFPGNISLQHSGEVTEWPMSKDGQSLMYYRHNDFGSSKSYHVAGKYHNFFGGYWEDDEFGFGHAGRHETMPGKKLWLWSLARDGGIWEDLLTDHNGQYMEYQAGRLLNQYFNEAHDNPITEMSFAPHLTDQWEERWFPVKGTDGITAVTENIILHIIRKEGGIELNLNALARINDRLIIKDNNIVVSEELLKLNPMEVYHTQLEHTDALTISIGNEIIYSDQQEEKKKLERPLIRKTKSALSPSGALFYSASELNKRRNYSGAASMLKECLKSEPAHLDAHNLLAEIHFRNGLLDSTLYHANMTLQFDTYHFDANYLAGLAYKEKGDYYNALDAFGFAGRSMKYRSAAYTEIAQLELSTGQLNKAIKDARYALDFNVYNVHALQTLILAHRQIGDDEAAHQAIHKLLAIDPLNHFARFTQYLVSQKEEDLIQFQHGITNEFIHQSYLEIASVFLNANMIREAIDVLEKSPSHPVIDLWLAYTSKDNGIPFNNHLQNAIASSADFVFPHRHETIDILEWAAEEHDSWKLKYYLGLAYWSKNRLAEAAELFTSIDNQPDNPSFYVSRAHLLNQLHETNPFSDLKMALRLGQDQWRFHHEMIKYLEKEKLFDQQLQRSIIASKMFPDHDVIGLDHAQSLLNNNKFQDCLDVLSDINVLPSEGSFSGRNIYGMASLRGAIDFYKTENYNKAKEILALSYLYPENLGSGKPFHPDERMIDFLMAQIQQRSGGNPDSLYKKIVNYNDENKNLKLAIFTLLAHEKMGHSKEVEKLMQDIRSHRNPDARWVNFRWVNRIDTVELIESLISKQN